MNACYRLALFCGALPLVTGVGIFVAWLVTGAFWLMLVGIININVGLALFVVGMVAILFYAKMARREPPALGKKVGRKIAFATGLLVSNFPVALTIVVAALLLHSRYVVTVVNESDSAVDRVVVAGGGVHEVITSLPPGAHVRRWVFVDRKGVLKCTTTTKQGTAEAVVEGYVCEGLGGRKTIRIMPDGSMIVN